jgi:opacity protein-like surface antigen
MEQSGEKVPGAAVFLENKIRTHFANGASHRAIAVLQLVAGNQHKDHTMKQKTKLGLTLLAGALALGLAAPAFAQDATTGPGSTDGHSWGLLGSSYTGAALTYDHVSSSSPSEWRGFAVDYNQPLAAGFDFNLNYNWQRADNYLVRLTQQDLLGGVTAFAPLSWGKPYAQALAGWEWQDGAGHQDNSFVYVLGAGVEFQATSAWVVTPYVNFERATSFDRSEINPGVKTAYRFTRQWSVTASLEYEAVHHAKDGVGYTIGVNYHY